MAFGITPTGFVRKTFDDIVDELGIASQGVFGPGINLDPESPNGQFHGIYAEKVAELWEVAEDTYHSGDPFQAEGTRLDSIMHAGGYPPRIVGETDAAYRLRIFGSTVSSLDNNTPSLPFAALNLKDDLEIKLSAVTGVTFVRVIENETDIVDPVTGLPPHSYSAIVQGGADADIAEVTWASHPPGIPAYGDTSVDIVDALGNCRSIKFERPTEVDIEIEYEVRVYKSRCGCRLLTNVDIKNLAVANINSNSCPIGPGEDVLVSRIYGAVSNEPGVEVCSVQIAKLGDPLTPFNVTLAWNEIPIFDAANVSVTIVSVCP